MKKKCKKLEMKFQIVTIEYLLKLHIYKQTYLTFLTIRLGNQLKIRNKI